MTTIQDLPGSPSPEVGSPRRRKEDALLITGRSRWTDNHHSAAIEVDTQTGWVHLRHYFCVDDVGILVNPLMPCTPHRVWRAIYEARHESGVTQ